MIPKLFRLSRWACLAGFAALGVTGSTTFADDAVGFVRLGKPQVKAPVVRGQNQEIQPAGFLEVIEAAEETLGELSEPAGSTPAAVPSSAGYVTYSGAPCPNGDCWDGHHQGKCWAFKQYLRCKFGYFLPTGCGGAGCPPFGHYGRVYPQDPWYFDGRDGQLWAAQGYGVPVAVPLAPVVGHTYNYGWGVPSSRLTPVSRPNY